MIFTTLGVLGALMVLGAYLLLVAERLRETNPAFLGLNILGSALILVSLAHDFNLAATIMQAAWIVITLAAALLHRHRAPNDDTDRK